MTTTPDDQPEPSAASLRENERHQLAALVDSSDDAIVSKSLDGIIQTWNAAAERMYGWTAEEAIGQSIEIVIPESRRDEEVGIRARIARGEDVLHYETFRLHRDGHQFEVSVSISPVKDGSGNIIAAAGFARDITALRMYETRQQLAALVDSSDDAIVSMDASGAIQTWNAAAERMYGWTAEEAIGQSIDIVIPEARREEEVEIRSRIARGEDVRHYETFRQKRSGRQFEVSLSISPVRDGSGAVVAAAESARDISEQARLRDERARATGLLQRFVAFAAHDFHAPLGRAMMQAQRASMMVDRGETDAVKELLDQVVANCRWMQSRTKGLLTASRLQEDRQMRREVIDAEMVFSEALSVLRSVEPSVADARISHDPLPQVASDESLLGFLFQNLVHNACRYRRPNMVAVIHVDAEMVDGGWRFNVRDNGRGVRPEIRGAIFEPYVRDDDHDVPGTGIGLALCKQIVEWHGGSIWVDAGPDDVGSIFRFTLRADGAQ